MCGNKGGFPEIEPKYRPGASIHAARCGIAASGPDASRCPFGTHRPGQSTPGQAGRKTNFRTNSTASTYTAALASPGRPLSSLIAA